MDPKSARKLIDEICEELDRRKARLQALMKNVVRPVGLGLMLSLGAVGCSDPNDEYKQDTLIKAADRVATQLLRRHGSGRDLEVRLAAARHTAFSRVFWLVSPVLRTRLPGIVIRFHPPIGSHEVGTDGADFHIGCTYLPFGDATRRRHRYTMVFDHDVPTPVQKLPEPPKTMLVRLPLIHEQASAVSLWR